MEKKQTILSLIFVCVIVGCAIALIMISGITARDYNYVMIEINPRVEFLCNNNYKVVSSKALNEDAEIVLSDLNYIGLDIAVATVDFIDQCARCGYINIDDENNAVNVTIIDGLTQALDVHVVEHIYNYLRQKEILCAVCENYEDRDMFNEKKSAGIEDINKYKLIKRLNENHPRIDIKKLSKLSEVELIKIVHNIHTTVPDLHDATHQNIKQQLLKENENNYTQHIAKITNATQQKFEEKFDKYQKTTGEKYREDFEKAYNNWQINSIN